MNTPNHCLTLFKKKKRTCLIIVKSQKYKYGQVTENQIETTGVAIMTQRKLVIAVITRYIRRYDGLGESGGNVSLVTKA